MSVGISNYGNFISNNSGLYSSGGRFASKSSDIYGPFSEHENESTIRKMESDQRREASRKSIIDQSKAYAEQLRASRTKSKDNSLEKKKLQYSFKKISSQIIRSKDSMSARRAVQAARHEISRLKRLKNSGEYDEEELQLAIDHAKSMEKVAKKKANHLEQEEMIERNGKGLSVALEEVEKDNSEENEENLSNENYPEEEVYPDEWEIDPEQIAEYDIEMQEQMLEMAAEMSENMQEIAQESGDGLDDMMSEMSEAMNEMMEELDLNDLAESLYAPDPDMSEEDLKMLKIKHRTKEMKEIAEADKEYLKGIMEHEKNKAANMVQKSDFGNSKGPDISEMKIVISMPGAAAGGGMIAPTTGGGFDVSV
jgi:hypothetical protein